MRLALAMMVQNERPWLELHLPVLLNGADLDGVVILDGGSHDGSASTVEAIVNGRYPLHVGGRAFDWDFSAQANALVELGEQVGYDALLRLDPDELLFPSSFARIKVYLAGTLLGLRFPRLNFGPDRLHFNADNFPDPQFRAFWLRRGVSYHNLVHEMPVTVETWNTWPFVPDVAIYHYSGITPPTPRRWLQHSNYARLSQHLPPLLDVPEGFVVPADFERETTVPYEGAQPLDPLVCGAKAPFAMEESNAN